MKFLVLLVLPLLVLIGCSPRPNSNEKEIRFQQLGIQELNGDPIDLAQLKDKVVIVNLWATWCKPCIAEMPALAQMQHQLHEDKFKLFLVSDEDLETVSTFIQRKDFELNFVRMKVSLEYLEVGSLPTTLVFSGDGTLLEKFVGAREWDSPEFKTKIASYSDQ